MNEFEEGLSAQMNMTIRRSSSLVVPAVILALATTAIAQEKPAGFTDYGVGAKVAECRGVFGTQTADGRCLVIANGLDTSPISYVLVTDIDTGETKQYFCPEDVPQSAPYGSLMHSNGKFYTTQGSIFLEFDPAAGEWTFQATGSPIGSAYIGFTEGPDGTVWAGSVYQTGLISFNPETRELKDHGRMDPKEKYLSHLAVDEAGWVYCGIGNARCNIVAYNPATSEKRQLVKEEDRVTGAGNVYPTNDGAVCGVVVGKHYRLFEGQATPIEKADVPPRREVGNIGWGAKTGSFPDGRRVRAYNLPDKWLEVYNPETDETKRIEFDYETEGVTITSLGLGPNGIVYGSTCHPMHMLKLDVNEQTLEDFGPIPRIGGGNMCAFACQGQYVVGASYGGGRLWLYDPNKPWNPAGDHVHIGLSPQELIEVAEMEDGKVVYDGNNRVALIQGTKLGAEAHFKLNAPADGKYYLYIFPFRSPLYATAQFLLDGKEIGAPYEATNWAYNVVAMPPLGPVDLEAGEHRLTARIVDAQSGYEKYRTTHLWFGIRAIEFTQQRLDKSIIGYVRNPRVLAKWKRDICRPRTALAHPDGKHVMMAGYAGYGLCGGGIGIYNLQTDDELLLTAEEDLLPGHSCITLKALPNGDLVGGTAIGAPGGGHQVATAGELFILDWKTKKITFHAAPPGESTSVVSIQVTADGLVYGLTSKSIFFVFDPKTEEFTHSESFEEYGGVPRHALQIGPDGNLYAALTNAIVKIAPDTLEHEKLADTPVGVTSGGPVVNGLLVFAHSSHVWSYRVPCL